MLDLGLLERKLDEALEKETPDSINRFFAKHKYKELCDADFNNMSVEQIKLNITERAKYLETMLKPKKILREG